MTTMMRFLTSPSLKISYRSARGKSKALAKVHASSPSASFSSKRLFLAAQITAPILLLDLFQPDKAGAVASIQELEVAAYQAYSNRSFDKAISTLSKIIEQDVEENRPRWLELRANVLVDSKQFKLALQDYDLAIQLAKKGETQPQLESLARLHSGKALALEGLSEWETALNEYTISMDLASDLGFTPDPYIINSVGNCYASLEKWKEARESYLISSQIFQGAKGFRGRGGSTTNRLDGAIFSASNAALMLVQMGQEDEAIKEMERVARRAPGSVDMRAALAAQYYSKGLGDRAEDEWDWACTKIVTGCSKYKDQMWLKEVRRWPPVMVEKMRQFLKLQ